MQSVSKNELVKQISMIGQLIEKKSKHLQDIDVYEGKLIACLTIDEQQELDRLLTKLENYWKDAHKKAHKSKV